MIETIFYDNFYLAKAYVDPGSGHLMLQLALAFLAGTLFYLRSIIDWFRGDKTETQTTGQTESPAKSQVEPVVSLPSAKRKTVKAKARKTGTKSRGKKISKPATRKRAS